MRGLGCTAPLLTAERDLREGAEERSTHES